jgi:hypothetical protein
MAVMWIDEGENGSVDNALRAGITLYEQQKFEPMDELYRVKPMDVSISDVLLREKLCRSQ